MDFELVDAHVDVRSAHVVLRYITTGEMPDSGAVTFTTTFTDPDGHRTKLGHEYLHGRLHVFRHVQGNPMHDPVDVWPIRSGHAVTILYPIDNIEGDRTGRWRAELEVDGTGAGSVHGTY